MQKIPFGGARVFVLGLMIMIFALSCLADTSAFHSYSHPTKTAVFSEQPFLIKRQNDERLKQITCVCKVLTGDKRPLYQSAETVAISEGFHQYPGMTSCARLEDNAEVKHFFVPRNPVMTTEKTTLAACEARDGKTYRSDHLGLAKMACSKTSCINSKVYPQPIEFDVCRPYNAEVQPAFWYCQAS